jgi:hypothetical protein
MVKISQSSSKKDYELFLLGIPLFGIFLILFWVSNLSLIEGISDKLTLVFVLTILSTAAVVGKEVKENEGKSTKFKSPLSWLVSVTLLWLYFYPAYLKSRTLLGLKDRSFYGIILMVAFIGISYDLHQKIEERRSEIMNHFGKAQKQIQDAQDNINETLEKFGYKNNSPQNSIPLDIAELIEKETNWNDLCRGGSGDNPKTVEACDKRDGLVNILKSKGYCYQSNTGIYADSEWQKCK